MATPTTVQVQLKLRGDTAANWTSVNPTLLANELGRETDTGKIKIGDGTTAWTSLAYQLFGGQIGNSAIAADAEIAVSKLADGAARQLLQTDAAGTGVEWTSNVDLPGTLDVTGITTLDSALRLTDSDASNWVAFQAPATVASNVTWTLPAADGTSGQVLSTDGSGVLAWADDTGAVIVDGGNFANGSSTATTGTTIDGGSFT